MKPLFRLSCLLVLLAVFAPQLPAEPAPARHAAGIATAHPLATRAGEEILALGGNAFDAAVAISAALAVVEPYGSGLGGGGFWLLHIASEQREVFVDARETAPGAATPDMYLDAEGQPVPGASLNGPLASGIPGSPAGLAHLAAAYGRLPLTESLAPAIALAEQGFRVDESLTRGLRFRANAARRSPAFSELFYPGGQPLEDGALLRQHDLARTLRALAAEGHDGFYRGPVAELLVAGVREGGGIWSLDDLASYRVVEREPVRSRFRDITLISAPPPSSGGIALANMLNIISGFDLDELDQTTRRHIVIEAMRRAYRDRSIWLGDPDFVEVPVALLTDPNYAAGQRTSLRTDRATRSKHLSGIWPETEGDDTTHFSVIDTEGNRVAGTMSINTWYGAAFVPPGTGVILNNEMDDFVIKPGVPNGFQLLGGEANAIEPGKRMLSSMSPTFLESARGVAVLGTPGGSRIITMVLLATLAWAEGADAAAMTALPRFHHQYFPDQVVFEPGAFSAEERRGLEALGHRLVESPRLFGNMQVVTWDRASGRIEAAGDPRRADEGEIY
ncbi:MAG: gamma-glutamyltransferase [Chromatiales bacterium]|nr:gamma-glutamyltransferase [Chromatiales bacterium]